MQSQLPYIPFQSKIQNQGLTKITDRSIPSMPLRHVASNPNISLEINPKNQSEGFRGLPLNQVPSTQYNRPRHGDLARSLILPQQ